MTIMNRTTDLPDVQYQRLLEFRTGLRQFLKWSAQQASDAGLTGPQHQLLLAVRGHRAPRPPSIGELSNILVERQHSVSGLVDRASAAGLVRRVTDPDDRRVVRVALTPKGKQKLERLASLHIEELKRFGPSLRAVWHGLVED
jgi:DNA-binding MarR family transcriptional regulator